MDLATQTIPAVGAKREMAGSTKFTLAAGSTLKIKTTGNGTKILDQTVPEGKTWKILLKVHIQET